MLRIIAGCRSRAAGAGTRARTGAKIKKPSLRQFGPVSSLDTAAVLLRDAVAGDLAALMALHDYLSERGISMLPFEIGKTYWIETPTWYYVGTVKEIGALFVVFSRAAQIHEAGDLPSVLATGKFSSQAEITPLPGEFCLPLLWCGPFQPWPFEVPTKRTHSKLD